MVNVNTLIANSKKFNIILSDQQIKDFTIYKDLLIEWNKKINITAITEDWEIDIKHFLDSLSPNITNLFNNKAKVIDVGTGGGFPGLPLKILNNELDMTLLDSLNKRIKFLDIVIEKLNYSKIKPIHGRAEEMARKAEYREKFDIAISRAVASLDTLAEYCIPFVKLGGYFISMKSLNYDEELNKSRNAIEILGGKIVDVKEFNLPSTDMGRSLIIIEKIRKTSTKYPRPGGKPKSKPL